MHPPDKIDRFIELRANGLPIPKIFELLHEEVTHYGSSTYEN